MPTLLTVNPPTFSGLIMKPNIAQKASKLLLQYADVPPDIILQKCLLGELPECQECTNTLISSKRLLMHHIGYNTSTSDERSYNKNEFQCGWRHPFVSFSPCSIPYRLSWMKSNMLFIEWQSQRHCIVIDLFPLYIANCNFIIAFIV